MGKLGPYPMFQTFHDDRRMNSRRIRTARGVRWWLAAAVACAGLVWRAAAGDRVEVDLSGPGWRLWLDRAASWENDELFFPPPALASLPVNAPTGGWESLAAGVAVAVPGTVEEYLQTTPGPAGDIKGVSWWYRTIDVPAAAGPRQVLLRFESLRLRAEVFVNRRLVGYDAVGNTPFEVDVTPAVRPGGPCELAVRITDPGGNFDWHDSQPLRWGRYTLPMSHGFGGITGRVRLVVCAPVYIDDLAVLNRPGITDADAFVTVRNTSGAPQRRDLTVRVIERGGSGAEVFATTVPAVALPPGDTPVKIPISAPAARTWDLDHPNLYGCEATLRDGAAPTDSDRRTFGFRWFAPENVGTDAVFRLNGKRIVLRTAISWGFWPINGIFPTDELAEKQIRAAKAFGLNMLNFHRAIGNPLVLEKADELGLLYFEEPGAYKSADHDPFGRAVARAKLLRMVRRDRSHPSLVIYNLINEWDSRNPHPDPAEIARHRDDMAAAHRLDPSRVIVHTSAWARAPDVDDPAKLHFRPYDDTAHLNGWYDVHHAGGPATWNESLYRSPTDYHLFTADAREIVYWGEEGAISTPPRLEKIVAELDVAGRDGWDVGAYRAWDRAFDDFLTRKGLRAAFPTVDALTSAMGAVSLYHQGRRIENIRLSNLIDGYAINGWESEVIENHSGIVDCFRNPKGGPAILAYYNQPLYMAVKVRNTIVQPPATIVADFFVINEKDLRGPHRLLIRLCDSTGRGLAEVERPVSVRGGETYGELLAAGVELAMPAGVAGMGRVEASLVDPAGTEQARGRDAVLAVDWRDTAVPGTGAVWEDGDRVCGFLRRGKGREVPALAEKLGRLDWLVVARAPDLGELAPVPTAVLRQPGGGPGLQATFFADQRMKQSVRRRADPSAALAVGDGEPPDPALPVMRDFAVRWEGTLTPPRDGRYTFAVVGNGRARLSVNHVLLADFAAPPGAGAAVDLSGGKPVPIQVDFLAGGGAVRCELQWVAPEPERLSMAALLERVRRDGTTLVILEQADAWLARLAREPDAPIRYAGAFRVGKTWLGGIHFVRDHPLFRGLPVNAAMDWPYQSVVHNGEERLGLRVEGEELVAGCWHSYPMELGTAVGIIPLGRGHVIFSTLDIAGNLNSPDGPADVARLLLGNYLDYGARLASPGATAPRAPDDS